MRFRCKITGTEVSASGDQADVLAGSSMFERIDVPEEEPAVSVAEVPPAEATGEDAVAEAAEPAAPTAKVPSEEAIGESASCAVSEDQLMAMTNKELRAYAEARGISTAGLKTKGQLVDAVRGR